MKVFILAIIAIISTQANAEIFKCIDKNKKVYFQDQVCSYKKGKLKGYQTSGQYTQRDPIAIQNEITEVQNLANKRDGYTFRYYRPESNELIEKPKREDAERQARWDSLSRTKTEDKNIIYYYKNNDQKQKGSMSKN